MFDGIRKTLADKLRGERLRGERLREVIDRLLARVGKAVEKQLDEARTARKRLVIDWQRVRDEVL